MDKTKVPEEMPKLVLRGKGKFTPPPGYEFKDGKWIPSESAQTSPPTCQDEKSSDC